MRKQPQPILCLFGGLKSRAGRDHSNPSDQELVPQPRPTGSRTQGTQGRQLALQSGISSRSCIFPCFSITVSGIADKYGWLAMVNEDLKKPDPSNPWPPGHRSASLARTNGGMYLKVRSLDQPLKADLDFHPMFLSSHAERGPNETSEAVLKRLLDNLGSSLALLKEAGFLKSVGMLLSSRSDSLGLPTAKSNVIVASSRRGRNGNGIRRHRDRDHAGGFVEPRMTCHRAPHWFHPMERPVLRTCHGPSPRPSRLHSRDRQRGDERSLAEQFASDHSRSLARPDLTSRNRANGRYTDCSR